MSDKPRDEFIPPWGGGGSGDGEALRAGWHIRALRIVSWEWRDQSSDKPYAQVGFEVEATDSRPKDEHTGFRFQVRQYMTAASEGMVRYFLVKFGFSEEELKKLRPILSQKAMIGLQGEAIIHVELSNMGMLRFNLKGYGRPGEDGLDDKMVKIQEAIAKKEAAPPENQDSEPEVDVNADVQEAQQADPRSALADLD